MIQSTGSISISAQSSQQAQKPQGPRPGGGPPKGGKPDHADVIEEFGSSLSTEARDELLSKVEEMQANGATDDEIKQVVDQTLSDNGVELPHQKSGSIIDVVA
jgi:hypothetical protein